MHEFKFPKSIGFTLVNLDEEWLKKNPLFIGIKTFAKNKISGEQLWGGVDYHLDLIKLASKTTRIEGEFLKEYATIYRNLSAMERRPIKFHYGLVEIELMHEANLTNWANYLRDSKNFFAYEKVLGSVEYLIKQIEICGNPKINYFPYLHKIRDVWDDGEANKEYVFNFQKK